MLRDFAFFISEAVNGLRRSGIMIFIAIITISVSMMVFGVFLLLSLNINQIANIMTSKLEIMVYLKDDLTKKDIVYFKEKLNDFDGVKSIEFVNKKQAWSLFKQRYTSMNFEEYLDNNPLPHAYKLQLNDNLKIKSYAQKIKQYNVYVDDVSYGGILSERIEWVSRFIKLFGIILVGILTAATLFIVVNTIRLTVIARKNEITIMHLVGATDQFIKGPFLFEGLFMGILGSLISVLFLKFSYDFLIYKASVYVPFFPVFQNALSLNLIFFGVFCLGSLLGIIGAYISVSKTLTTATK